MFRKLFEDRAFVLATLAAGLILFAVAVIGTLGWIVQNPGWAMLITFAALGVFALVRAAR